jgi:hypothetical protein
MTLAPAKHDLRRLEERNGITRLEPCPARWRGQLGLSPDRAIHREAAGLVAENVLARCFGVEEIGGTAGRHHVRTDRASKDGISPSFWTSLVAGGVLVDAGDAEERAGARKPHRRCVYGRRRASDPRRPGQPSGGTAPHRLATLPGIQSGNPLPATRPPAPPLRRPARRRAGASPHVESAPNTRHVVQPSERAERHRLAALEKSDPRNVLSAPYPSPPTQPCYTWRRSGTFADISARKTAWQSFAPGAANCLTSR